MPAERNDGGSSEDNENSSSTTSSSESSDSDTSFLDIVRPKSVVPPPFEAIKENIRLNPVPQTKAMRRAKKMVCECTYDPEVDEEACGEDCLNRLIMIECNTKRCPCGEVCSNQRFQKAQYPKLEVFKTDKKGWGLRTLQDLESGAFVIEYCGEICSESQFKKRARRYAKAKRKHHYFMKMGVNEIVDATEKGNVSRFINHSCEPHCETQKWMVCGELRVGFFAIKRMKKGDEITFDYQFQRYGRKAQKCYCGSASCRGVIGGQPPSKLAQRDQSKAPSKRRRGRQRRRKQQPQLSKSPEERGESGQAGDDQGSEDLSENETCPFDKELQEMVNEKQQLEQESCVRDFARLMLNADSVEEKLKLLTVLQNTMEPKCLKEFLKRQSVKLMKNWLDDMEDVSLQFKLEVLKTLQHLPIASRNTVTEIIAIIEKWRQMGVEPVEEEKAEQRCESMVTSPVVPQGKQEPEIAVGCEKEEKDSAQRVDVISVDMYVTDGVKSKRDKEQAPFETTVNVMVESGANLPGDSESGGQGASFLGETTGEVNKETKEGEKSLRGEETQRPGEESREKSSTKEETRFEFELESGDERVVVMEILEEIIQAAVVQNEVGENSTAKEGITVDVRQKKETDNDSKDLLLLGVKVRDLASTLLDGWKDLKTIYRIPKRTMMSRGRYSSQESTPTKTRRTSPKSVSHRHRGKDRSRRRSRWSRSPSPTRSRSKSRSRSPSWSGSWRRYRSSRWNSPPSTEKRRHYGHRRQRPESPERLFQGEADQDETNDPKVPKFKRTFRSARKDDEADRSSSSTPPNSVFRPNQIRSGQRKMNAFQTRIQHQIHSQTRQIQQQQQQPKGYVAWQPTVRVQVQSRPPSSVPPFDSQQQFRHPHLSVQVSQLGNPSVGGGPLPPPGISVVAQQLGGFMPNSMPVVTPDKSHPEVSLDVPNQEEFPVEDDVSGVVEGESGQSASPPPPPLPMNWKSAIDSAGRLYYYHVKTRASQWEFPVGEVGDLAGPHPPASDEVTSTSDNVLIRSDPPVPGLEQEKPPSLPPASGDAGASSMDFAAMVAEDVQRDVDKAKKEKEYRSHRVKEEFRSKVSQVVIHCLNQHYRPDCPRGRIENADDFKHLARKLTYGILEKELKQGKAAMALEFTGSTRMKILEFIKSYMKKFGEVYRR